MREGKVSIHDTKLMVWEEKVNEPNFYRNVFGPLIRQMRNREWIMGQCPQIKKRYPSLNRTHRAGKRGALRCKLNMSGRCIELEIWSEDWASDNPNGHQYCFGKRQKMPYLTGHRCDLELLAIQATLTQEHGYAVEDDFAQRSGRMTSVERIQADYAKSWHTDKALGRPRVTNKGRDETSADGDIIEHGQTAWHRGRDGRVRRGVVYYSLNSMWWFVTAPHEHTNAPCWEIHTRQPANLRRQIKDRDRRARLERLINQAAENDHFERALTLRRALFGDVHLYRIWSTKHGSGSYWGPNQSGYVGFRDAGRYTEAEAVAIVRRYPEQLSAIPIGTAPKLVLDGVSA